MLRMRDARTGWYQEIRPARPDLLRVCAHTPQPTAEPVASGLRVLLVTDLLARAAEEDGLRVLTTVVFPGQPPEQPTQFESAAGALGIRPPAARASLSDARAALAGTADVSVISDDGADDDLPGLVTRVGAARLPRAGDQDDHVSLAVPASYAREPLAIRLALMCVSHRHEVDLTEAMLAGASDTISSWRSAVAGWATSPSSPVPERITRIARAAFDDLDIALALALLRCLALDAGVAAGAKSKAFSDADRILGLDLARDAQRPDS